MMCWTGDATRATDDVVLRPSSERFVARDVVLRESLAMSEGKAGGGPWLELRVFVRWIWSRCTSTRRRSTGCGQVGTQDASARDPRSKMQTDGLSAFYNQNHTSWEGRWTEIAGPWAVLVGHMHMHVWSASSIS